MASLFAVLCIFLFEEKPEVAPKSEMVNLRDSTINQEGFRRESQ
jgi:hypothetical protein